MAAHAACAKVCLSQRLPGAFFIARTHRANIAHKRVRMEGWRQRRLGSKEDHSTTKGNYRTDLTLTGFLMGLGRRCTMRYSDANI